MAALLSVKDVVTAYGKIEALRGVTLEVAEGSITCLLGPNGAGKTTLLFTTAGVLRPRSGSIQFAGKEITGRPPHSIVRAGIALVPENRLVFPHMTVIENLRAGAYQRSGRAEIDADIERLMERFPRLRERAGQDAGTLSGGEQQMLAVARALMSRPKLLLMDEPSLGLAPLVVQDIFKSIRAANAAGTSVLLVEQNARYALETGSIVRADRADVLLADPKIKDAYLGD